MPPSTPGLHHVTAIAGDPQRNADFYVETLGLRLVKRTVNHDDPGTYHLYFGDDTGTPGTNITTFPWGEQGRTGEFGAGQTSHTSYAIAPESVEYWEHRLEEHGCSPTRLDRFGDPVLQFEDPDGIGLELVGTEDSLDVETWDESPVPDAQQLRGFDGVTLTVAEFGPTETVLTDLLGYDYESESDGRRRFRSEAGGPGSVVDLVETDRGRGRLGVGTVHHVAFSVTDPTHQERWRNAFVEHGLSPSEVIDRKYFQSVYVREPGGVLFEFATMEPGFTADEDRAELGERLVLPPWLEDERDWIEAQLPPFEAPSVGSTE